MANPYIIVLGNEKGGSGKTTTSMHLIFSLIHKGYSITSLDLDIRQLSLNRYLENRAQYYAKLNQPNIMMPTILNLPPNLLDNNLVTEEEIEEYFDITFKSLNTDFLIIDTPGSNSMLSCIAHSFADLIVSPINDSFIDLDLIAKIIGDNLKDMRPSIYSAMIWERKIKRFKRDHKRIEWVVIRNRLSNLDSNNRRNIEKSLDYLAKKMTFRLGSGFSERIIYRELFPYGLTLLDVFDENCAIRTTASHIAARQELKVFLNDLRIPILTGLDNDYNYLEYNPYNTEMGKSMVMDLTNRINVN